MAEATSDIEVRIRRGGRIKLFALVPLALALLCLAVALEGVAAKSRSDAWWEEQSEAGRKFDFYKQCLAGTMKGEYYCGRPGAPPPPAPLTRDQAPEFARADWDALRARILGCGAGTLLLGLVALVIFLKGRGRQVQARKEDPSRVVIGHSRALEILVWSVLPLVGVIALGMGLGGPRSNRPMVPVAVVLFVLPFLFQLVLYAIRPSEADAEGLRLGFGRCLAWRDFTGVTSVTEKRRSVPGGPATAVGFYYQLRFRNGAATLRPMATSNWERLREFINRGVGRDVV